MHTIKELEAEEPLSIIRNKVWKLKYMLIMLVMLIMTSQSTLATKEYSHMWEKDCNGNKCEAIFYSGERYAKENGEWKKIEEIKDFTKGVETTMTISNNYDLEHIVNITSWNMTTLCGILKLDAKSSEFGKFIPVTVYNSEGEQLFGGTIKLPNKNSMIEQCVPFGIGITFKFGTNSTTVTINTSSSTDDVFCNNRVTYDSNDNSIYLGASAGPLLKYVSGLRFPSTTIPKDSTINNAYLKLESYNTLSGTFNVSVYAQKNDNPATFNVTDASCTLFNARLLNATTSKVEWNVTPIAWEAGVKYNSTNISSVINEMVTQTYWGTSDSLVLFIENRTNGQKNYATYDYSSKVTLTVVYTEAVGDSVLPFVYAVSPANDNVTTDTTPDFSFNYTDETAATAACKLWLNTTSYGYNASTLNNTLTSFTANATLSNGLYTWLVNCSDGTNTNVSATRSISIDNQAPVYSNTAVNNSNPSILDYILFSSYWTDAHLANYTFSWNATGITCDTWANDSTASFNNGWANISKQIPAACLGKINSITYTVYANDTLGQQNNTGTIHPFTTTTNTCTYSGSGQWNIACSDHCNITITNAGGNWVNISGTTPNEEYIKGALKNITNASITIKNCYAYN